jgi:hypothetical protein
MGSNPIPSARANKMRVAPTFGSGDMYLMNGYGVGAYRADERAPHCAPHGMIGTVLIALAGEPLTIFELTAR